MRLLILTSLVVVICHAHAAIADPDAVWDRTYKHETWGGTWPCPDPHQDVVVENGRFSIPWEFKDLNGDDVFTIGSIEGAVRASGMTEDVRVRLIQPLPRKALRVLEKAEDGTLDRIHELKFKVKFSGDRKRAREIDLSAEPGGCYARWTEDRKAVLASARTGSVDCSTGQYAVAPWSAKHAYKAGELTRVAAPGQPTRLYRCIDDCKSGMAPVRSAGGERETDSNDDDDEGVSAAPAGDAWAFFAECAGAITPEAQLPATGSAKWDVSYGGRSTFTQDWRCPSALGSVVVSRGKFSIPWKLSTRTGYDGDKSEDLTVGSIEGVIAADGATTLRSKFTVDTLPPEVTRNVHLSSGAAMAALRTAQPTMTFILDTGKMNPHGQGRRATLDFGKGCEYELEAKDYKPQEFREEDGWRVDCNPDQLWHTKTTYNSGDEATVGGSLKHKYRCRSSHCDGRPGNSSQWEKSGRCR